MKNTRQRFQAGSLRKVSRKTGFVWEYRYRDNSQPGCPMRQLTLSATLYPTESRALAALQPMLLKINGEEAFVQKRQANFGTLIDRYIEAERLKEVKALKPGNAFVKDGVQYSTACSYLTSLNSYIRPRWSDTLLATTMNTYGNAQMQSKRSANTKVVEMVLPSKERLSVAV